MENCPICLNEMSLETSVSTLCQHQYCEGCLNTWLENHNTCPLCRHQLQEEDIDEDDERYLGLIDNIVRLANLMLAINIPQRMNRGQWELQRVLEQDARDQEIIRRFEEHAEIRQNMEREHAIIMPLSEEEIREGEIIVREWQPRPIAGNYYDEDDIELGRPQQSIYNHIRRIRGAEQERRHSV